MPLNYLPLWDCLPPGCEGWWTFPALLLNSLAHVNINIHTCMHAHTHTHTHISLVIISVCACTIQFGVSVSTGHAPWDFVNPTALAITYRVRVWWWRQIPR